MTPLASADVLSIDTNIFLYALNSDCAEHSKASEFIVGLAESRDVVICDLVLVELYLLLRNPAVFKKPWSAREATAACVTYRRNPNWQHVESAAIMDELWAMAGKQDFARRRIIDGRIALTLRAAGVTDLATRNVDDFKGFGLKRVFDPLSKESGQQQR